MLQQLPSLQSDSGRGGEGLAERDQRLGLRHDEPKDQESQGPVLTGCAKEAAGLDGRQREPNERAGTWWSPERSGWEIQEANQGIAHRREGQRAAHIGLWGHNLLLARGDLDARPPSSAGPAWHQGGRRNQITWPLGNCIIKRRKHI